MLILKILIDTTEVVKKRTHFKFFEFAKLNIQFLSKRAREKLPNSSNTEEMDSTSRMKHAKKVIHNCLFALHQQFFSYRMEILKTRKWLKRRSGHCKREYHLLF
jgi:hypothetical protein